MYRLALLFLVSMVLLVSSAQAIEMFTNFHNGENIGYPPLVVPTKFYGHGGWQPASQCRPERVESIEPVPAMTPTGFIRPNHSRRNHDGPSASNQNQNRTVAEQSQPATDNGQYISDRRRSGGGTNSWNGNNSASGNMDASSAGYNQPATDYDSPQAPTSAKIAPKSDGWTRSLEPASDDDTTKRPTSVLAHPGSAPQSDAALKQKSTTGQTSDQRAQPPPGSTMRRTPSTPSD